MTNEPETWRTGATWYRNSIDLIREWRDAAINHANKTVDGILTPPATATNVTSTSFDSTDETETPQDTFSQDVPTPHSKNMIPVGPKSRRIFQSPSGTVFSPQRQTGPPIFRL